MDNIPILVLASFFGGIGLFLFGCLRLLYYAADAPQPNNVRLQGVSRSPLD
jgi:hypothetical protein